jgi:NAD(P)-dependent dehydrogenase (short-subunit alcohol dehydrogenase family)
MSPLNKRSIGQKKSARTNSSMEKSIMPTIIVTGGSRGIGRAVVLGAAKRGWDTAFSYISDSDGAAQTAEQARSLGTQSVAVQADSRSEAETIALFDAGAALGPITGCVVNAGVVDHAAPLADMSADRLRRMMEINVVGALLTAREAARRMPFSKGGQGGSIVMMSSAAARLGSPNLFLDYAASKGAIDTATKGLALELANDGVRVNAVRPGIIDTEIHASGGIPDRVETLGPLTPMGRAGSAEEVASSTLWLLSEDSSYVTGAHLDVGGGR